jgi:hypothetical protein
MWREVFTRSLLQLTIIFFLLFNQPSTSAHKPLKSMGAFWRNADA